MGYTSLIISIVLIFFVILFVLLLTYIILINKSKQGSRGLSTKMPPIDYMIMEGVKCPDYWQYIGDDKSGNHICKNVHNVSVMTNAGSTCYDNIDDKTKKFKIANMDQSGNMGKEAAKQRCNFIANCGPNSNTPASWLGINSDNMSPGWVNCGII
jgi:hypothetical protein